MKKFLLSAVMLAACGAASAQKLTYYQTVIFRL